jgi:hypothetical protein
MLTEAYADALEQGIGIVKIVNTSEGPKMFWVPLEEFMDLAESLKHIVADRESSQKT